MWMRIRICQMMITHRVDYSEYFDKIRTEWTLKLCYGSSAVSIFIHLYIRWNCDLSFEETKLPILSHQKTELKIPSGPDWRRDFEAQSHTCVYRLAILCIHPSHLKPISSISRRKHMYSYEYMFSECLILIKQSSHSDKNLLWRRFYVKQFIYMATLRRIEMNKRKANTSS